MQNSIDQSLFFPAALAFFHLARAAATSLALTAGLLRRSFFLAGLRGIVPVPLILAHLAFCPAAIAARPAADMRRFFFGSFAPRLRREFAIAVSDGINLALQSLNPFLDGNDAVKLGRR